jgi:hypothetical protein
MRLNVPVRHLTWVALALAACAVCAWLIWPNPAPESRAVIATPPPAVAGVAKVATPVKAPIKAYPAAAKARLKLPAVVAADPAKVVVDSSLVGPDSHPTLVTTLVDTTTGETLTLSERQSLPWLAPGGRNSIWLGVGVRHGEPVMRAQAEVGLFQVKALDVGVLVSADVPTARPGDTDLFAGVGVRVDF